MDITHLAIIMDGNRRWAASRDLKPIEGHRAGTEALAEIVKHSTLEGIKYLTVYALSTENLKERSPTELTGLIKLINEGLKKKLPELQKEGVRIEFLGDLSFLPRIVKSSIEASYSALQKNSRIQVNICLNYGSRAEIINAVKNLLSEGLHEERITEKEFQRFLHTKKLPDPEIIIRTGGQKRLSNFLLWQAAYSELFFSDTLWPDFKPEELDEILLDFAERKRNFGS